MTKKVTAQMVLDCPMGPNDADAKTIKAYLIKLLLTLFDEGEGFSGKRPFGNSSWEWELYKALVQQKYADGSLDEDGYLNDFDELECVKLIFKAIKSL